MKSACVMYLLARVCVLASFALWASTALAATRDVEPGADLPSVAREAADGDVLRLNPGRYSGPVLVDAKRLTIEGPTEGEAIIAPGQSNVVLAAVNGGVLELSAVSVETSAESPLGLFAQGASINCANCQIRGAAGSAVYVESGTMTLDGGMVSVPSGTAVLALSGSTVRLLGTRLRSETGSPLVAQEAAAVEIKGSTIDGQEETVLTGVSARISVDRSEFMASGGETNALHVETGGELVVADTRMRGGRFGLAAIVQPETKVSLTGGLATGGSGGLYFEQKPPEPAHIAIEAKIDNILAIASGTGKDSIALRAIGPLAIITRQSTFLSSGVAAVAATGGASLTVERGILSAVEAGAAAYGDVPGEARLVGAIVVPPASVHAPGVVADTLTAKLAQALRADAALAQSFTAAITETLAGGQADKLPGLAERVSAAAASLATIGFEVLDGAGRTMAIPFSVVTLDGEAVAESSDGKPVAVAAGAYLVEGKSDAVLASDVDIAAGEERTVRTEAPDGLWLDINQQNDGPSRLVLFRPVEPDKARATLRAAGGEYSYATRIFRRSGLARACLGSCPKNASELPLRNSVTEKDVALALESARDLVAMELERPADGTDAEKARFVTWEDAVLAWALPALASYGNQTDAALMVEFYRRRDWSGRDFLDHLAYLEYRLGLLETGQLASLAANGEIPPDATAKSLLLLDYYGVSSAHEKLVELMQNPKRFDALTRFRDAIASRAAGMDWPEFPAIAGDLLQRQPKKPVWEPGTRTGYLSTLPFQSPFIWRYLERRNRSEL